MGGVLRRFTIIMGILGISVTAFAQSGLRDRDPDLAGTKKVVAELQQANLHSGPFYLLSRIRLADAGFAEDYYLPTGDVTGGISLRIEAPQRLYFVPQRKTVFTLELIPGYSFFKAGSREGQFDYSARADAHFLFNHLYIDAYTLLSDQLRAQIADVNRLATQRDEESGVGGELKYSSRTSAIFSARYRETTFPNKRFQPSGIAINELDRVEKSGRIGLHHKTFPLTSLFVAAEVSDYTFDRAIQKDSSRTYLGGGFIRSAGRTSLRAEAGRTLLKFDDPTQHDFSGITGQVTLTRGTSRWTFAASGVRDVGFSIFDNNNFYVSTLGRISIDYAATRRLTLRGGTAVERDDYEIPVGGVLREDTLTFTSAGFLYAFRKLQTGIEAGWYTRESNVLPEDSGIRWVLHLSFTP